MNITSPDDKYVFFLSLCSPINCAFGADHQPGEIAIATAAVNVCPFHQQKLTHLYFTLQGCQYVINQQALITIGRTASFQWHIVNTTYFYIDYTNGDDSR